MGPIKLAGCIVALVVLLAFISPVLADTFTGFSQAGSTYSGNQVYLSSGTGAKTTTGPGSPNLGYVFVVKGNGTRPTYGDVSSHFNYYGQSGFHFPAGQKISYSESSRASGIITQYSTTISYDL